MTEFGKLAQDRPGWGKSYDSRQRQWQPTIPLALLFGPLCGVVTVSCQSRTQIRGIFNNGTDEDLGAFSYTGARQYCIFEISLRFYSFFIEQQKIQ
ncbi:hypothetical protein BDV35DRAFT_176624 [Aspergillus flavus]|uniref:Uncharacterized protein n=1 Tax=Aspergillus flavus TaxID=5059 RepID=A0A5N6H4C8_ASPFL|nr:hypothetical protein BDV35DRAFT_176624 [Aspergillus flavus]